MWFCKGGLVHDGEFSPTFHTLLTERNHLEEKKCMNYVADLAFLLDLVKSLDFLTSICYFAIVAPQTKAGQTELRKLQEVVEVPLGGGMDPRGAHLPHPNWFGQISIHQKTGGKILGV